MRDRLSWWLQAGSPEGPSERQPMGGSHLGDEGSVVGLGALTMLDDGAAVVAAPCLGAGLAAGIGGPLDDEERAGPDSMSSNRISKGSSDGPPMARLGYRSQDRRGCGHGVIVPAAGGFCAGGLASRPAV